jgi:hypothetical protein
MSQLCSLLKLTKKENSPEKLVVELDRKRFREIPEFSKVYDCVEENDFRKIYGRLYSVYQEKFSFAKLNPPLTNPEEFQNGISKDNVLEIESWLAILYFSMKDTNL